MCLGRVITIFIIYSLLHGSRGLAVDYIVNDSADTNTGSGTSGTLRYVLTQLNSSGTVGAAAENNTITINSSLGDINLIANLPVIQRGVTINGPLSGQIIDGNNKQHSIFATFIASLNLSNLALQNGLAQGGDGASAGNGGPGGGGGLGAGGGIYIDAGQTLTLNNTTITNCKAQGGAGANGGAFVARVLGGGGGGASWSRTTAHGIDASGVDGGGDFYGQIITGGSAITNPAVFFGYGGGDGGDITAGGGTGGESGGDNGGIAASGTKCRHYSCR